MPYPLPAGSRLLQALGFLAFSLPQVEILMPTKKTRGQELALEQHVANQALHCHQLQIEHVHNSVKRCRIVKNRLLATNDLIGINSIASRMNIPFRGAKSLRLTP